MAEATTSYVHAAADGLPARVVGPWVDAKVHYVDRYAEMFATGMKNRWERRAYVELFAGPGMSLDRKHGTFITGSAIRALDFDFTDYVFVDIDPIATTALFERVRARGHPGKQVHVYTGNCNAAPAAVRNDVPAGALTLAFVDPTTWQVTFEAIRAMTDARRVDLLFTFHAATMRRMVHHDPPALTRFFGTDEWRGILRRPREGHTVGLLDLYNRQLATIGYLPGSAAHAVPIRNTRNRVIYYLVVFSKSDRGLDFWKKAAAKSWSGQLELPWL